MKTKMENKALGEKLKTLRLKNGFSQDELAESAGVSLRTVQRIENAEAVPRMDTIKRLFQIFGMSPEEVLDWSQTEDKGYLIGMNMSGLAFLLLPILGVILPLVLWMSRKDKVKGVAALGREIVNFQLTWITIYYLGLLINGWVLKFLISSGDIAPSIFMSGMYINAGIKITIWLLIIGMILWNTYKVNKGMPFKYFPKINFLK
ncbi:helix-turn-helix domain-containing protein [Algoriphagus machipongonensis]|uniref:Toxin-antitoxin system, antitoxin component, Xre family n=1 Tax=Algoriphagus machipongonensis TaxID=388413 RepID=A3I114_9BACT|nr:helix-turn-helix domain-containing protein [Algoriphagus machipongonensis]EAZ80160.1 toxin-antitoxin system, antitoxin component, Xre family [Algoriphagus machipongonensis]